MTSAAALATVTNYGRSGGSARARVFDWLDHLRLPATSETYLGTASLATRTLATRPAAVLAAERRLRGMAPSLREATLLLSRRASPFGRGRTEELLLTSARHSVYDFDDALMLPFDDLRGRVLAPHMQWRRAVRAADVVLAGNDWLAEHAARHAADVVVVPSCVEPTRYVQRSPRGRDGPARAVWLGSPSTEHYLGRIEQPLREAHRRTGLRLTVISAGTAHLRALQPFVDRVPWTLDGFAHALAQADFGVMPLDDSEWSRGKCAYKLLQYGAAALPMVGDPVGANARVLQLSGGMAPVGQDEWADALVAMATMSETEAAEAGRRSLAAITAHYSFGAWADRWRAALALPIGADERVPPTTSAEGGQP